MVYVDRNGRVLQRRPWNIETIFGLFMAFIAAILAFFKSLFEPLTDILASSNDNRRGGGGGGGGGGWGRGGGGPGNSGGRGPRPPERRIGRMMTLRDCTVPGGG